MTHDDRTRPLVPTGEATAILPVNASLPITVIGNEAVRSGHHALAATPFVATGHPILLPGHPQSGSAVMVAEAGAERACFSVNHGAGRVLGRKQAIRTLDQGDVDRSFAERDILTNCRSYPRDEAPDAYKDFDEVLGSVKQAGLAREVARLEARFVIKDAAKADD